LSRDSDTSNGATSSLGPDSGTRSLVAGSSAIIEVEVDARVRISVGTREGSTTRKVLGTIRGHADLDAAGVELSTSGRVLSEAGITLVVGNNFG